ncbi:hypothetical protein D3C71_1749530 [compost metagenome]
MGRRTLSTNPITNTPYRPSTTPCQTAPLSRNQAATGTQTSPAPTAGNSDKNAINTAQSNALGMSRNQKIKPPNAPCVTATSRLPLTVARTTRLNLSCRRRF